MRTGRFLREKLISDHGLFFSTRANKERERARFVGHVSGMHRALDGWMLARAPPPKLLPPKNEKPSTAKKNTAVWHYYPKRTATCDTIYKGTAMSEWSEGMALRLLLDIR